ncbi:hypothetical protein SAMN05192569_10372 [Parageobacillus thermantarcticus]|uniref:Uncharacterized protein n=1 Tax=Parageobacillus thermantarcticus TaxID=186116 RepID=A0A1I0TLC5_9BACL|nr:hypothetical protein [Parageobacillus thermantarcticus]SFA52579.1 hypothetical protein SAMN05192569_10372 [Parageobacillus thermantarcticus]
MNRYHPFQDKAIVALSFFFLKKTKKKKSPTEISLRRAFQVATAPPPISQQLLL